MQEKDEKYTALYKTQDKIIDIITKEKLGFYLTGGTALQRFHFDSYRYSDDLDFFLIENGESKTIHKEFELFVKALKDNNIDFTITPNTAKSPNFRQIIVKENKLKIDLVNDIVFHEDDFVMLENGLKIDSIQNIFANKIETSISRNEIRDLFDIYTILKYTNVSVSKGFELLDKKTNITPSDIIKNIKQRTLNDIADIIFKSNAIRDDFVANFRDLIETRLVLDTNMKKSKEISHKSHNKSNENNGVEL